MQLTFKNLQQQTFKLEVEDKVTVSEGLKIVSM